MPLNLDKVDREQRSSNLSLTNNPYLHLPSLLPNSSLYSNTSNEEHYNFLNNSFK